MDYENKRSKELTIPAIQQGNKAWWTSHTMSYDWKDKSALEKFSDPWFADIHQRFLRAARVYSESTDPFDELMRVQQLLGQRVLEVGCGMGFHSELLARAGAELTAIDLSPTSVAATTRRFELRNLVADVRLMDAEI